MAASTIRHTLIAAWPILSSATNRSLTEAERAELTRLTAILEQGIPCRPIFNRFASEFCAALRASVLSESTHYPESIQTLLDQLDSLRDMVG